MNHKFLLLFLVCIISLFHCMSRVLGSPIIGGFIDSERNIKYHVSLHRIHLSTRIYVYFCGGTIIREKYILSAASCFMSVVRDRIVYSMNLVQEQPKIIAGTNKRQEPGIEGEVVTIFIPKSYKFSPRQYANIAVVQLRHNLGVAGNTELKMMPLGQLPDDEADEQAIFCGFGYYELETLPSGKVWYLRDFSETNRFLTVKLLGASQCPDFHSMICSLPYDISDIRAGCYGDTGAGLIYEGHIVGVFTHGPVNCDSNEVPNMFTRLSVFMDEILLAMNEHTDHLDMKILRKPLTPHQAEPRRLHN